MAANSEVDWRDSLTPAARQRIRNNIMDTLKRYLPTSLSENQLQIIATRFETKFFYEATSQIDYLRKLSHKILSMKTRNPAPINPVVPTNGASSQVSSVPENGGETNGKDQGKNKSKKVKEEEEEEEEEEKKRSGKRRKGASNITKRMGAKEGQTMTTSGEDLGEEGAMEQASEVDWRDSISMASRQRIRVKIIDTLKSPFPISHPEDLNGLQIIATRSETKIFDVATSQTDYLRKLSHKILSMEMINRAPIIPVVPSDDAASHDSSILDLGEVIDD